VTVGGLPLAASAMDHFAGLGYDVWTMDHERYGFSDRTDGKADPALVNALADFEKQFGVIHAFLSCPPAPAA
jgi:hypothetical protein